MRINNPESYEYSSLKRSKTCSRNLSFLAEQEIVNSPSIDNSKIVIKLRLMEGKLMHLNNRNIDKDSLTASDSEIERSSSDEYSDYSCDDSILYGSRTSTDSDFSIQ